MLRHCKIVIAIAAVVLPLAYGAVRAQPIFTTAPPHLQRLTPNAPAKPVTAPVRKNVPAPATPAAPVTGNTYRPPAAQLFSPSASVPGQSFRRAGNKPATPAAKPAAAVEPKASARPAFIVGKGADGGAGAAKAGTVIRHLTNSIQGFRLSGEIGTSEWPVYFTQAQTRSRLRFQVGYLSAVSVMPEASYLKLQINDQLVSRVHILPTTGVRKVVFDIPPGLVKPGFNAVRLTAEQRHRVDCSIEATYELWTQIDPTQTGFILPGSDPGALSLADLAALPPDAQGALPVRVVMTRKASKKHIERIVRAVQLISLVGRFEQPHIDVGPIAKGDHGINLVIGTRRDISGLVRANDIGPLTGPATVILPPRNGLRTTIVVTGGTEKDIDTALRYLKRATKLKGTPAGIRAARAFPGYRVFGGETVTLRDLGFTNMEFTGRHFKLAFNLIMPPDFYAADYGKAELDIAGGYAPGLTNASQIVVSVNKRNAVSLQLGKESGHVFQRNPIPLQLGHLRPGLNRIEIAAQLPAPEDKACDPLSSINSRKRFLLLNATKFTLPKIARIARVPDLAITATGGFPFTLKKQRPNLYVPAPDAASISAAATLASQMAIAAGKPIDFRFVVKKPKPGSGVTLAVAPYSAIDASLLDALGVDSKRLSSLWQSRMLTGAGPDGTGKLSKWEEIMRKRLILQRNFPAACHLPMPAGGFKQALLADRMAVASTDNPDDPEERDLFKEWDQRVRKNSKVFGYVTGFIRGVADWINGNYSLARIWLGEKFDSSPAMSPITAKASLVMAQNITGPGSNDIWTVVTAPNTNLLARSVACLTDPRVWHGVGGRTSVLNPADGAVTQVPVGAARLVPTQPLSLQNVRLIVAGWFSLNSKIYVAGVILLALLLAAASSWFLQNVGRPEEG